jgi:hypothetical protein
MPADRSRAGGGVVAACDGVSLPEEDHATCRGSGAEPPAGPGFRPHAGSGVADHRGASLSACVGSGCAHGQGFCNERHPARRPVRLIECRRAGGGRESGRDIRASGRNGLAGRATLSTGFRDRRIAHAIEPVLGVCGAGVPAVWPLPAFAGRCRLCSLVAAAVLDATETSGCPSWQFMRRVWLLPNRSFSNFESESEKNHPLATRRPRSW